MQIISEHLFVPFCFILSCFFIVTTLRFLRSSPRSARLPPGPPRLPIIGNIHQIGKLPHHSFADLSRIYGPIMHLKFGRLNTVIVSTPEAAREVLKTHDQTLSGRSPPNSILSINHHNVSVAWTHPSSPHWRMLRRLSVTQLFSPQRVEATKALRVKKVQELVSFVNERSESEEAVDIARASFTTVLNIISNILFSVDLGSYGSGSNGFQDSVIGDTEAAGRPDLANFFPFLAFLDLQGNSKKMKICTERLFKVFRGFIDTKTAEKSLRSNPQDASNSDFLDAILDLTVGDEAELDNNDIEHLLLDMFIAGTDTTSSTVEWAMAELLSNPETMAKAQAEIGRMIGQNGLVQEPDISELPYVQAVVKETLRMHPPVPLLLPRKANTDVEIFGYLVPKDAQVLVNVWAIGRDSNVWENPSRFQPERFLGEDIDVKGKEYELTPFGAGRRICPGLPLAVKMVSLMLVSLLYSFDWKLPNTVDLDEAFGITLHKANPLHAVPVKKIATS
ncbi:hypothetical protein HA466_0055600 [Hirschfeldia incana]|nr:hypothetical protein HA466_0055600 [Hirschfeldia incana]